MNAHQPEWQRQESKKSTSEISGTGSGWGTGMVSSVNSALNLVTMMPTLIPHCVLGIWPWPGGQVPLDSRILEFLSSIWRLRPLFISQGFDGVEARGSNSRHHTKDDAHRSGKNQPEGKGPPGK